MSVGVVAERAEDAEDPVLSESAGGGLLSRGGLIVELRFEVPGMSKVYGCRRQKIGIVKELKKKGRQIQSVQNE